MNLRNCIRSTTWANPSLHQVAPIPPYTNPAQRGWILWDGVSVKTSCKRVCVLAGLHLNRWFSRWEGWGLCGWHMSGGKMNRMKKKRLMVTMRYQYTRMTIRSATTDIIPDPREIPGWDQVRQLAEILVDLTGLAMSATQAQTIKNLWDMPWTSLTRGLQKCTSCHSSRIWGIASVAIIGQGIQPQNRWGGGHVQ